MPGLDKLKHPIKVFPALADGKRYPVVIVLHGNFGLSGAYAARMFDVADAIAKLGYLAAVPRYYPDNQAHMGDDDPDRHVPILAAAIEDLSARSDADPERIGLVGYSLGAGVAISYMAGEGANRVKVFVDFFGFTPPGLPEGVALPPTAIFHNRLDELVPFRTSLDLLLKLDRNVESRIAGYVEASVATPLNHVFDADGPADTDSRASAQAWLRRHMPPTGA